MVIIQTNAFNRSRIKTVIALLLTSNLRLAEAPGNILIAAADSGLPKDSVANVSQVIMVDKGFLSGRTGKLPPQAIKAINDGLRLVLSL